MLRDFSIERLLYTIPAIIIALVFHEFAHAAAARLQGDNTAVEEGRFTLNPLKHLDPLGFIFLLIAGFGWSKPVIFNVNRLKNPHSGPILVALAGPFMNFLLALLCLPFFHLILGGLNGAMAGGIWPQVLTICLGLLSALFYINLGLFIFNLIPLPPLDGSYVLFGALPNLSLERKLQIYQIGSFALLAILIISSATGIDILPIGPMVQKLGGWMLALSGLN